MSSNRLITLKEQIIIIISNWTSSGLTGIPQVFLSGNECLHCWSFLREIRSLWCFKTTLISFDTFYKLATPHPASLISTSTCTCLVLEKQLLHSSYGFPSLNLGSNQCSASFIPCIPVFSPPNRPHPLRPSCRKEAGKSCFSL